MKIFVAILTYDGKIPIQLAQCLLNEQTIASANGDVLYISFLPSCSIPAAGRNQLTQDFLDSDCEKLVFLDSDVTFEMGSLIKIVRHPVDVVAGCYRYKHPEEWYPVMWLENQDGFSGIKLSETEALIEVEAATTGFMCISREALAKFRAFHNNRNYEHSGHRAYAYFQMIFKDGVMCSDDTGFCKEFREAGGQVYIDPEIPLIHWDFKPTPYPGHIGNWLKNRPQKSEETQSV